MQFTVYLLKHKGEVVYIGQSKNVRKRRAPQSTLLSKKAYDEVAEWRMFDSRAEAVKEEDRLQHDFLRKHGEWPRYNKGCSRHFGRQTTGFVGSLL